MDATPDEPVPLRDAEIARHIARAAAKGAPGDRRPTLEQLLAAFQEPVPTPQARHRVTAALRLAGIRTEPSVEDAPPGSRVALHFTGVDAPSSGTAVRRALAGVAVLAAFIGAMALASGLGGDDERLDTLPETGTLETTTEPGATTPTTTAPAATTGTGTTATRTAAPTTTGATTTTTAPTRTTSATTKRTSTTTSSRTSAARRRAAARRAAARRRVSVRLTPAGPTYLCVDDGAGRTLFTGTLTSRRTFRGRRIRLNVGLASTRVAINGRPYRLRSSPAGVDITRERIRLLPLGQRPCSRADGG